MPDFHGPIQHVTIAATLWLILALPAAATVGVALYCLGRARHRPLRRAPAPLDRRARQAIAIVSIGFLALSFVLSAYHAFVLATKPSDARFLLQHLWPMVRVGQLDASFDLAFDPLSAALATGVAAIGLPILVRVAFTLKDDPSFAHVFAWLNGFVAAMLLLVLADNFVLLFFGWEGVGLCSWGLAGYWGTAGRRGFLVSRVGDVGLVLGIALLYWGLGGAWENGDYVPDLNARFSSVEVGPLAPPRPPEVAPGAPPVAGKRDGESGQSSARSAPDEEDEAAARESLSTMGVGFLTLTSYSGAVVFMDDARVPLERAPGELLRAPFSQFPVRAGLHSFRIQLGSAVEDSLVTHVAFGGEREIALASFGPTVTFRNLRDQLAAHDAHGSAPLRDALAAKRVGGGWTVLTLVCLCFVVAVIGKSAPVPLHAWFPEADVHSTAARIHALAMLIPGVYLSLRLAFLFGLLPGAGIALAVIGGATALLGATIAFYAAALASPFFDEFDRRVIGGLVSAGAIATRVTAWIVAQADDALVDGAVRTLGEGTLRVGGRLQRAQNGRVQTYVLAIVLGVIALAFVPYWLR